MKSVDLEVLPACSAVCMRARQPYRGLCASGSWQRRSAAEDRANSTSSDSTSRPPGVEVVDLLAEGETTEGLARGLQLSRATIRPIKHILGSSVHSRDEAVRHVERSASAAGSPSGAGQSGRTPPATGPLG
jgi:DNA-binding NarL/FixJ family response regulator